MKLIHTLLLLAVSCASYAAEPSVANRQMASNYYAYPYPELPLPELTDAPQGYEPFHIEHYGRHGSRWHIGEYVYSTPVSIMLKADSCHKLTPRGKELLAELSRIADAARGRDGELTPLGAEQHRGIARRMVHNFPQVFADSARIDARSTVVIRCILSMDNELQEMLAANPKLRITSDASYADMDYMNHHDTLMRKLTDRARNLGMPRIDSLYANTGQWIGKLFTDTKWAKDSLNTGSLFWHLFIINANSQSHKDQKGFYDIFTDDEITRRWTIDNADCYLSYGNSPHSSGAGQHIQRNLLNNIIHSADTAIVYGKPSANLRFGHETCLLPLTVLMELDHYGAPIENMEEIAGKWHNYDIFPMGGNIQMIFYAPKGQTPTPDNVLVKVLLNEKERHLPVATQNFPYYKWSLLRDFYSNKLAKPEPKLH